MPGCATTTVTSTGLSPALRQLRDCRHTVVAVGVATTTATAIPTSTTSRRSDRVVPKPEGCLTCKVWSYFELPIAVSLLIVELDPARALVPLAIDRKGTDTPQPNTLVVDVIGTDSALSSVREEYAMSLRVRLRSYRGTHCRPPRACEHCDIPGTRVFQGSCLHPLSTDSTDYIHNARPTGLRRSMLRREMYLSVYRRSTTNCCHAYYCTTVLNGSLQHV